MFPPIVLRKLLLLVTSLSRPFVLIDEIVLDVNHEAKVPVIHHLLRPVEVVLVVLIPRTNLMDRKSRQVSYIDVADFSLRRGFQRRWS